MVHRYKEIRVSIVLLPLILIISWNETLLWRFERNRSWCWWDMKEIIRFWSKYRVVTPYFDCLMKWNCVMKVWKKLELDVNEIWRKMMCFRVSIGLLPLILIVSWNETLLWRFERKSWCQWDMKENVRFWSKYRVVTPLFWLSCEMKLCYEGLKEIGVDVDEIWRKILDFGASIRVVTPYFDCLVKWNCVMKVWKKSELMLMRGKEKLLGLVYACGYSSELLSFWIHYYLGRGRGG